MHEFCDTCPGCRPVLIDLKTGKSMAPDSPIMIAVSRVWNTQTTYAERKAFIDVTVHNRHTTENLNLAGLVRLKIEQAIKASDALDELVRRSEDLGLYDLKDG